MEQSKLFPTYEDGIQSTLPFIDVIPVKLENPNQFSIEFESGESSD